MAMGVDDYVAKPIDARTLLGKLAGFSAPPGVDMGTDESALDGSQLEALAAHLPADSVRQLLGTFCDEIDAQVRSIEALSGAGDLAELAREAHSLAGCSGNFGALKLSRLAREIEAGCEDADRECAGRVVARLRAAAAEASTGLRDWVATEGHPTAVPPVQQNPRSRPLQRKRSAQV